MRPGGRLPGLRTPVCHGSCGLLLWKISTPDSRCLPKGSPHRRNSGLPGSGGCFPQGSRSCMGRSPPLSGSGVRPRASRSCVSSGLCRFCSAFRHIIGGGLSSPLLDLCSHDRFLREGGGIRFLGELLCGSCLSANGLLPVIPALPGRCAPENISGHSDHTHHCRRTDCRGNGAAEDQLPAALFSSIRA